MNQTTDESSAILNATADIASWNRPRSIFELREFVLAHDMALDVEDFCI